MQICGDACRIAVETIANAGLGAWYDLRAHSDARGASTADPRRRAELDAWRVPELEAELVQTGAGGHGESAVTLTVEGMRCAACAWLVERLVTTIPGVNGASVDFPLRRVEVRFDPRATRVHTMLEALAKAGYLAAPYTAHAEEESIEPERRARLRGLGISALFGMQVMLLSIALYASDLYGGMDARFEQLFRWLAMVLTVPVLVWPGRPFFSGAAAALRNRRLTMDVPVAIGLAVAFAGSAFATVAGKGEIWFDSVVMFVALLGGVRYLELIARRRATATIRSLARAAPLVATRLRGIGTSSGGGGGTDERVPAAALRTGDRVRILPGEVVPADGAIRSGSSSPDESLLTGESTPVARAPGAKVLAGSVNGPGVIEIEVSCAGDETVLGGVLRRAEQAARERPAIALLADRAAAWFVGAVLVLAAGVTVAWLFHEPARVVPVLVSVLVVTCPCALSLATPAAMTAALGALARASLIVTRSIAVERLALTTHRLADKTGTLTEGRFRLRSVSVLADVAELQCVRLAAALERYAAHPVGSAILAEYAGVGGDGSVFAGTGVAESGTGHFGSGGMSCLSRSGNKGEGGHGAPKTCRAGSDASADREAGRDGAVVEDAAACTGGVTGRIGGVRYAVGSREFVARACGLSPGAFAAGARRGDADSSLCREPGPERDTPLVPTCASTPTATGDSPGTEADGIEAPFRYEADVSPNRDAARAESGPATRCLSPGSDSSGTARLAAGQSNPGATNVFLAREGAPLARFVLSDTLRAEARCLVDGLRTRGIETTIASGDSPGAVEHVADALGVTHHLSELSPDTKLREAIRLADCGERVLMLGDGVNDAPALAGAHVSVAMGHGAAAAASRADAVLIGSNPRALLAGLDIARHTRRIVKQNLAWALGYNLVALPLAAAGAVPPWAAAVGMSLSSLAVVGNALRLGRTTDARGG